jgi:hypothetical protein
MTSLLHRTMQTSDTDGGALVRVAASTSRLVFESFPEMTGQGEAA